MRPLHPRPQNQARARRRRLWAIGSAFTEDGLFGSIDAEGNQVDDGTYEAIDEKTIVIHKEFGNVTFHYRITNESLFLDPVMPKCAQSGCFDAQWAVAVAYPGLPWERAD